MDLKSAKKRLGDRSSALVDRLRKESERRKMKLARKQSDLIAQEEKKQKLLQSLYQKNGSDQNYNVEEDTHTFEAISKEKPSSTTLRSNSTVDIQSSSKTKLIYEIEVLCSKEYF